MPFKTVIRHIQRLCDCYLGWEWRECRACGRIFPPNEMSKHGLRSSWTTDGYFVAGCCSAPDCEDYVKLQNREFEIEKRRLAIIHYKPPVCTRKVRHPTRKGAEIALAKAVNPFGMNVYECVYCGGFHIGHNDKERKKALKLT